ncbi:MAG TPA: DUF1492 domain-containing protein [Firmicutes bacterium]|nr:DUF1492 domain-containing protein [Bacillota bacterium]
MKWILGEDYCAMGREIEELREEISHIWSLLKSPRRHTASGHNDTMADGVATVVDLEKILEQKINEYGDLRMKVESIIEQFPSVERRLLRMRYIRRFTWLQIANRLYCDESTCRRMHRRLVRKLNEEA